MRELADVDIERLARELAPNGKRRGSEWVDSCPFHTDRNPSFGINLDSGEWHCFACGRGGASLIGLKADLAGVSFADAAREMRGAANVRPREIEKPLPPIPESAVSSLVGAMNPKAYVWLEHERGIGEATARRYELGLWSDPKDSRADARRFSIPVRDEGGAVRSVRLWLPPVGRFTATAMREAAGKIRSWAKGRGAARLFPIDQLDAGEITLCEGELDALALIGAGLRAITATGGAGTWRDEWSAAFVGKRVTVAFDNDDAGRKGAASVAASLARAGAEVWVVAWPTDRPGKHDITDEILRGNQ
jgi:DNA primase